VDKFCHRADILLSSQSDSASSMANNPRTKQYSAVYRQRIRAAGGAEVLMQLPRETVALLDELKERHGLRSRSQALLKLIEQGRETAQQIA
jgi:hypothetical protein